MRRYPQFSISSLLILTLAVACYCAGWKSAMWKAERDKQEAVRKAEEDARTTLQEAASRFPILAVPQPGVPGTMLTVPLPSVTRTIPPPGALPSLAPADVTNPFQALGSPASTEASSPPPDQPSSAP